MNQSQQRGAKMNNETETVNFLFPTDNTIKVVDGKKGRRFYKGSTRAGRFFPLSKKDFKNLEHSKCGIYQEMAGEFFKIN